METIKSSTDTETTQIIGKNFTSVFLEDLVRNSKVPPSGKRYSDEVKKIATTLTATFTFIHLKRIIL